MNKKTFFNHKFWIIVSFIIVAIIISLATASASQQSLGSFDQSECVDLIQTCSNCSYINITQITFQPTSQNFLSQELSMTKQGTRYNHTFCNTSLYGIYVYDTYGNLDGSIEIASVNFRIGEELDITQGFVIIGQIAMIMLFLSLGFTFAKERWKLRSFFYMMATGMGVVLLNSARILASQSGRLNAMGNVGLYIGITTLMFMTAILLIYFTIDIIDSVKQKKERKWI